MAASRARRSTGASSPARSPFTLPEPELVVVTHSEAGISVGPEGLRATHADTAGLTAALPKGAEFIHTFGLDSLRLRRRMDELPSHQAVPDLVTFLSVVGGAGDLAALAERLIGEESVAGAYIKPPAEPPIAPDAASTGSLELAARAAAADAPPSTPDFNTRQIYEDAAPAGIDARWAWTRPGGGGAGVRVVDVEGAWRFTHEDLLFNQGGVIGGTASTDIGWRNHGTAVAGEISGDRNAIGITGIAPDANIRAISIFGGPGSAGAIRLAADALSAGDIILIELHRPGPRNGFADRADQLGYIGVEWWPDDWAAIRYAIGRGVIVVEAAGNGAENLDDALYDTAAAGFPASWSNPFRGGAYDSGAIVVGAGAPPPGTHGRDNGPDRSRLDFSNFGSRVDCQGWGREVTTTGYGDMQGGASEDIWYTDVFSGTSSASPIIVGAVACYQGISRATGSPKTPAQARDRLRTTGSLQQDAPDRPATQRIGNRPDLRAMVGIDKWDKENYKENLKENLKENIKMEKGEGKELKDAQDTKIIKEREKEFLKREKGEGKEFKELNERKEWSDRKEVERKEVERSPQLTGTEERLQALEQELRPDLGAGALSAGLVQQANDAKSEKDLKDAEKPTER
jgi:hypothetical protein